MYHSQTDANNYLEFCINSKGCSIRWCVGSKGCLFPFLFENLYLNILIENYAKLPIQFIDKA